MEYHRHYSAMIRLFLLSEKDPQNTSQVVMNNLENSQPKLRIKLNLERTQSIFFTRRQAALQAARHLVLCRSIRVNRQPTTCDDQVKYHGVLFDKKLKFDKLVEYVAERLDRSTKALYSLLNRRSKLHIENNMLLAWGDCDKWSHDLLSWPVMSTPLMIKIGN